MGKKQIINRASVFVFVTTILFSSCTKQNDLPAPLSSYNLSAYANGELLTFNAVASTYFTTPGSDTLLTIGATWNTNLINNDEYQLTFSNIKFKKGFVGRYNLDSTEQAVFDDVPLQAVNQGFDFYYATDSTHTCSISINTYDSINKTISGTFSFTGVGGPVYGTGRTAPYSSPTLSLTNGAFKKVPLNP